MATTLLSDVRTTATGRAADVVIEDGTIAAVLAPGAPRPVADEIVDGGGGLLLPTLVDGHCHPDKTTWGEPWLSRQPAQSLADLIDNDVRVQKQLTRSVAERSGSLLERYVAHGARAVRAHVDVAPVHGLDNVRGVAEAAAAIGPALDVEIVAFPQLGILRTPGTAELLREAVGAGATVLGGIDPLGLDGDLDGHLDIVFGLAAELDVDLDIHLHDTGETGRLQVEAVLRRTVEAGWHGRMTLGHAFYYADLTGSALADLAAATAEAGVTLATCALGGPDLALPVPELRAAGVRVVLGSDGIRDAWSPFGNADMIDRTHLLAYQLGAATDEEIEACLDVAAHAGAELLGLPHSGLHVGAPADVMVLDAECAAQAVVDRPLPRLVLRAGRVVAADGHLTPAATASTTTRA